MIDINKTYRYRNGEEARILCVDRPNDNGFSVVSCDENGDLHTHTSDGLYGNSTHNHLFDLIEVKEKKVLWLNVYESPFEGFIYRDREISDDEADDKERIARIKVCYEEGQFDD